MHRPFTLSSRKSKTNIKPYCKTVVELSKLNIGAFQKFI